MNIKICAKCHRPYMASKEFCSYCPEPYTWNQESWANLGCLVLMILPIFAMLFFWFFLFLGFFIG